MKQVIHALCPHNWPDTFGAPITIENRQATKIQGGFKSINALTSEKLADMGNSVTFYSVLVEVELSKPSS